MPHRTTPPLTDLERSRRYRANHPEKKEEFRLLMRKRRAELRQKRLAERLGVIAPTQDEDNPAVLAAIKRMKDINKINTGLVQDDNPIKPTMAELLRTIQGSKV